MYESRDHLVEKTLSDFYNALDKDCQGQYSLENDMILRYFEANLACAIIEEFGKDFAERMAKIVLAIVEKYN